MMKRGRKATRVFYDECSICHKPKPRTLVSRCHKCGARRGLSAIWKERESDLRRMYIDEGLTLEVIGAGYGVTREWVRVVLGELGIKREGNCEKCGGALAQFHVGNVCGKCRKVCPDCGGEKANGGQLCWSCRKERTRNRWRDKDAHIVAILSQSETKAQARELGLTDAELVKTIQITKFSRLTPCRVCHKPNDGTWRNFSSCHACRREKVVNGLPYLTVELATNSPKRLPRMADP